MNTKIILACTVCDSRNYKSKKNKSTHPGRFTKTKFCPRCNQRTEHAETR